MAIVSAPPRQNFFRGLLKVVLLGAIVAIIFVFLLHRFSDTPLEKLEILYKRGDLVALQKFTEKKVKNGETNPVFYAYYAVAEYSTNRQSNLATLLGHVRAVDARPIFRREALSRIWQLPDNRTRAAQVLGAVLQLENPPKADMRTLVLQILEHEFDLESIEGIDTIKKQILPERYVHAKNLQFRATPTTTGKVLRRFSDAEPLWLRKTAGDWAYVSDADFHSGWVFAAYLKN